MVTKLKVIRVLGVGSLLLAVGCAEEVEESAVSQESAMSKADRCQSIAASVEEKAAARIWSWGYSDNEPYHLGLLVGASLAREEFTTTCVQSRKLFVRGRLGACYEACASLDQGVPRYGESSVIQEVRQNGWDVFRGLCVDECSLRAQ